METLYKRDAKGNILQWSIGPFDDDSFVVKHGLLGHKQYLEIIRTTKKKVNEINSRIKAKRKEGYKALEDLYDNSPVEGMMSGAQLATYLDTYLPKYNTTDSGFVLPMLAKTLEDNKPFEKFGTMTGQWKINGLRCIIGAVKTEGDLFSPFKLTYTSREGTSWNLPWLDDVIVPKIDLTLLDMLCEGVASLDGELYLPGYSVNDINSFVKNPSLPQHYKLQYWCYDICVDGFSADKRAEMLYGGSNGKLIADIFNIEDHYENEEQFVLLPEFKVNDITEATSLRDKFITIGFEGLILRNPKAEYAFGKRNSSMFKYKKKLDGMFEIVDIQEDKRGLPIYTLRNDINSETFECTINLPQDKQRNQLALKHTLIGKRGLVEYRERSGVKQVPFHAKLIKIYV